MTRKAVKHLPVYLEAQQVALVLEVLEVILEEDEGASAFDLWSKLTGEQIEDLQKVAAKFRFLKRVSNLPEKGGRK